jgi:hypothetical protein
LWMFWGVVSASLTAAQTTVAETNNSAVATSPATTQLQNQAATAVNQAASHPAATGGTVMNDATWVSGIMWGGIFLGCLGALVGSSFAGRELPGVRRLRGDVSARTTATV